MVRNIIECLLHIWYLLLIFTNIYRQASIYDYIFLLSAKLSLTCYFYNLILSCWGTGEKSVLSSSYGAVPTYLQCLVSWDVQFNWF